MRGRSFLLCAQYLPDMSCFPFSRPFLPILAAVVFGAVGAASAATHYVSIQTTKFSPDRLTIASGDTVIWTSTYGIRYNGAIIGAPSVTFTGGTNAPAGCAAVPRHETCVVDFPNVGEFSYRNDEKGGFNVSGVIVVTSNAVPEVTLTMPTEDQTILKGQTLSLSGTALDPDGSVNQVQVFVENDSGSSEIDLDVSDDNGTKTFVSAATDVFAEGTNFFVAVVTDNRGAATRAGVTVTAQTNAPPSVVLEALRLRPAAIDSSMNLALLATAVVSDPEADKGGGLSRMTFLLNGESQLETTNTTRVIDMGLDTEATVAITNYSASIATNLLDTAAANTLVVEAVDSIGQTNAVTNTFQYADLQFSVATGTISTVGGAIRFDLQVMEGVVYRIESSVNLIDWTSEFTFTADGDTRPFIGIADRDPMRFYRIVKDPPATE